MASKSIKGYAFEYFVRAILNACGFVSVKPDDKIIYKNGTGTMIHGLGQPHNADVLVSPPVQIPFYFPSRLLIECKCYDKSLGLSFVRNVLGLRQDINSFEVVDEQILKARRNPRRAVPALYDYERYNYQVALASVSGFKKTTQEFANVHRIPLITFQSATFAPIVEAIKSSEQIEFIDDEQKRQFIGILQGKLFCNQDNQYHESNWLWNTWFIEFNKKIDKIAQHMRVGVLDNGTLLFLYKQENENNVNSDNNYQDGCTLHWSSENNYWELQTSKGEFYSFELPQRMLDLWASMDGESKRTRALNLKQEYFRKIVIYEKFDDDFVLDILNLSQRFIKDALSRLNG